MLDEIVRELEDAKQERRYQMLVVARDHMLDLIRGKSRLINLPEGAEMVAVHFDPERDGFMALIAHESYQRVPMGSMVPTMMAVAEVVDLAITEQD